jgi:hypothetical protein
MFPSSKDKYSGAGSRVDPHELKYSSLSVGQVALARRPSAQPGNHLAAALDRARAVLMGFVSRLVQV